MKVTQSCLTLCDSMDCSPPGSSVRGILQVRILQWVSISTSKGSSPPRDQTQVSCIVGRFVTVCTTRKALCHRVWPKKKKIELENKRFNKKRNRKTKLSVVLYLGSLSIFFTPFLPNSKLSGPDLPESRF